MSHPRRVVPFLGAAALSLAASSSAHAGDGAFAGGHRAASPMRKVPGIAYRMPAGFCRASSSPPKHRTSGSLVVESPPRKKLERWLRLRTHKSPPTREGKSYWEGPEVPSFVPLSDGLMELSLLDPVVGGYMALYQSDTKELGEISQYAARIFSCDGASSVTLSLNKYLSRSTQLEIQDAQLAGDVLYFNEACQTYSKQANGQCSSLVAVHVPSKKLLWRTPPLTSNNVFRLAGRHIIVGYGFTSERAFLRVVRRSDGKVVEQRALPANHFAIDVHGDAVEVEIGGKSRRFRMVGFDTPQPRLVPERPSARDAWRRR